MQQICLYGVGGTMAGSIFDLDSQTIIIGRDPRQCAIIYPGNEPGISNVHCQIKLFNGYVEITDLGSSYGTFSAQGLQYKKNQSYRLNNGDSFYIGEKKNKFIVKIKNI
jgi:pSer/pThr/pTyr-binding forkhead associated (FHA) protein